MRRVAILNDYQAVARDYADWTVIDDRVQTEQFREHIADTDALIEALQSGHLSGAGLDVLEGEPVVPPALASRSDVILTPHVAFTSDASLRELRHSAAEEVVRVLRGEKPLEARNAPEFPQVGGSRG